MNREGDSKRHLSSAGVEWTSGMNHPLTPQELEASVPQPSGADFEVERILTPEESEAISRLVAYFQSYGLLMDANQKLEGVAIKQDTDDWTEIMHGGGMWNPELGKISTSHNAPLGTIAHEYIHALSRNKIHGSNLRDRKVHRSGLETGVDDNEQGSHSFFNLLNETITDEIVVRALGVSGEEHRPRQRALLSQIITSLAEAETSSFGSKEEVWKEFLSSYVNGFTSTLKKAIRDAFGLNALRILALAHEHDFDDDENSWNLMLKFFSKNLSGAERDTVSQLLLDKVTGRSK